MADRSLRGFGLGQQSMESADGVEFAERWEVIYDCPNNHKVVLPLFVEAEPPDYWQCRCGRVAIRRSDDAVDGPPTRKARTHWDMLLERRTPEQLEELLAERLELLRSGYGRVGVGL